MKKRPKVSLITKVLIIVDQNCSAVYISVFTHLCTQHCMHGYCLSLIRTSA